MDVWISGWVGGWVGGCMDKWMGGRMAYPLSFLAAILKMMAGLLVVSM